MEPWLERYAEAIFRRSADVNHDLKTPLNIAVLNLELLRMRVQKLAPGTLEDAKVAGYFSSIELELRRMARVFDAVFHQGAPPADQGDPETVDLVPLLQRYWTCQGDGTCPVTIHPARAAELVRNLAEGAEKAFGSPGTATVDGAAGTVRLEGPPGTVPPEMGKLFKFYYTDASGNPEISLATARLIAESYAGSLTASEREGVLILELSLSRVTQ